MTGTDERLCPTCRGASAWPTTADDLPDPEGCPTCGNTGRVAETEERFRTDADRAWAKWQEHPKERAHVIGLHAALKAQAEAEGTTWLALLRHRQVEARNAQP